MPPPPAPAAPALPSIALGERPAFPLKAHLESADIAAGKYKFAVLFEDGAKLFHTPFNGLDGVGVRVGKGGVKVARFAPIGPKGPTADTCGECHASPFPSSAGRPHSAVARDPEEKGKAVNVRSVISLFGNGLLQMLSEEMTDDLQAARDKASAAAQATPGKPVEQALVSKGVSFGTIGATATATGAVRFDLSKVEGVGPDLVVRPFGWKGDTTTVRTFSAGASFGAMGMQPEEVLWKIPPAATMPDLDADGVTRELSVGDVTAMTIYNAALETPTELARLGSLGFVQRPTSDQTALIGKGRAAFDAAGCATCHVPEMHLAHTRFEEPTLRGNGNFYDEELAKKDPNYDPKRPFTFDVLSDAMEPRVEAAAKGGAILRLYGDLKRHDMGRVLADPAGASEVTGADLEPLKIDGAAVKVAPALFLTPELWGVGNTGPYLHDNRAGSLREAILFHGEDQPPAAGQPGRSEGQESRDRFNALPKADQDALMAFLTSLRTFSLPEKQDDGSGQRAAGGR